MLSKVFKIGSFASQAYRSVQAFSALNQLRKGARRGQSVDSNQAVAKLAKSMRISNQAARDVYMGSLKPDYQAAFIVDAHNTLKWASKLSRFSPETGVQVGLMLGEVSRVHRKSTKKVLDLSRNLIAANKRSSVLIKDAFARRDHGLAKILRSERAFNVQQLSDLTDELKILNSVK